MSLRQKNAGGRSQIRSGSVPTGVAVGVDLPAIEPSAEERARDVASCVRQEGLDVRRDDLQKVFHVIFQYARRSTAPGLAHKRRRTVPLSQAHAQY